MMSARVLASFNRNYISLPGITLSVCHRAHSATATLDSATRDLSGQAYTVMTQKIFVCPRSRYSPEVGLPSRTTSPTAPGPPYRRPGRSACWTCWSDPSSVCWSLEQRPAGRRNCSSSRLAFAGRLRGALADQDSPCCGQSGRMRRVRRVPTAVARNRRGTPRFARYCWPVPVSASVCGLPGLLSYTLRVADSAPTIDGLKYMVKVQMAPGAILVPQGGSPRLE